MLISSKSITFAQYFNTYESRETYIFPYNDSPSLRRRCKDGYQSLPRCSRKWTFCDEKEIYPPPRKSIEHADKQRITQAHRKALLYPIRGGQYAVRPNLFVLFFYAIWCMDCRNVLINESKWTKEKQNKLIWNQMHRNEPKRTLQTQTKNKTFAPKLKSLWIILVFLVPTPESSAPQFWC